MLPSDTRRLTDGSRRSEHGRQETVTAGWGEVEGLGGQGAKPQGLLEHSGAVLDLVPFSSARVVAYFWSLSVCFISLQETERQSHRN